MNESLFAEKLAKKYGSIYFNHERDSKASGKIQVERRIVRTHYYIFYLDKKDNIVNTRIKAHEETHFLEITGHLNLLGGKMLDKQRVRIDLDHISEYGEDIQGKEIIAHLGSIYALVNMGLKPNEIKCGIDEFNYAVELYNRSII